MDEDPYIRRGMRRFWRWHVRIFVVASLATFPLIIWGDSSWYVVIPFGVGVLLTLHLYRLVRCPQCARRLPARVVKGALQGRCLAVSLRLSELPGHLGPQIRSGC